MKEKFNQLLSKQNNEKGKKPQSTYGCITNNCKIS